MILMISFISSLANIYIYITNHFKNIYLKQFKGTHINFWLISTLVLISLLEVDEQKMLFINV